MVFRPADLEATKKQSKDMSKEELEEYYVKDKDRRHTAIRENIGLTIVIFVFLVFLFFAIYSMGESIASERLDSFIVEIEDNVAENYCPHYRDSRVEVNKKDLHFEVNCKNYRD